MSIVDFLLKLEKLGLHIEVVEEQLKINAAQGILTPTLINEIKENKSDIISFFKENKKVLYSGIEPAPPKAAYALSSAQKRIFLLQQMNETNITYNMPYILSLKGKADIHKLTDTFKKLIERHDSLRTSFTTENNEPVQQIHQQVAFAIEYYDLTANTNLPAQKPLGTTQDIIHRFIRPFDLTQAPLLRVGLIKESDDLYTLALDMHHIISDGASQTILTNEFSQLYAGFLLAPLKLQYKDYSEWQNKLRGQDSFKKAESYWLNEFNDDIPTLDLPYDFSRPMVQSFAGNDAAFTLNTETTVQLHNLAQSQGVTMFMLMLAIYNLFLAKISNLRDIVVGTPVAGRQHVDLESIIGMFVNTLALRNSLTGDEPFTSFLDRLKKKTVDAFHYQDFPFEELVIKTGVGRDTSRNPIFDVMFIYNSAPAGGNTPTSPAQKEAVSAEAYNFNIAKFDITFNATDTGKNLFCGFEYSTALFLPATIERFIGILKNIIAEIINNPEKKINTIKTINQEEQKHLLYDLNATTKNYPQNKTIEQLFTEQAEQTPQALALIGHSLFNQHEPQLSLTYQTLQHKALLLAQRLREKGVTRDTLVAIQVERSVEMIVGVLGILMAGGAYLPIAPEYPGERILFILKDSAVNIVLTANDLAFIWETTTPASGSVDDLLREIKTAFSPDDRANLAYIMYTSGSTGKPKGVMVDHQNVIRLVKNTNFIHFQEDDRILQTGALEFDASTFEIWGALLNGLQLYVATKAVILNPKSLKEFMAINQITIMWLTSPLFNQMVQLDSTIFAGLRHLLVGGDELSPFHIYKIKHLFPHLRILNGYGPTENTTFSTTFVIENEYREKIPIGKPIANSTAYIVDQDENLCPLGIIGEIWVGGDGLSRGYMNNPGLTAAKFITASFIQHKNNRIYRTGDLGRWLPDGNIEFLGRQDQQVKIRGFRIEPGEIETILRTYPTITEALVLPFSSENGDKSLCAYFTSAQPVVLSQLREYLQKLLPEYMMPSFFVALEQMPLTHNGKIDLKALPQPQRTETKDREAPRDEIEKKLLTIWAEILSRNPAHATQLLQTLSINDNFFEWGGHSLKASILVSMIHQQLNVKVPLMEVFRAPRIKELAAFIHNHSEESFISIQPGEEKEYYTLSPAQKRLFILQQLATDSTNYNMPYIITLKEPIDKTRLVSVFNTIIARHDSLRTSFETIEDEPVQRIHKQVDFSITDLNVNQDQVVPIISRFVTPFALNQAPLLRVQLVTANTSLQLLMIDMHHIITDGTSQSILEKEFLALYRQEQLPPLSLQYKDYSEWQNSSAVKEALQQQEKYWLTQFESDIPVIDLPIDFIRPTIQSLEGCTVDFVLERQVSIALKKLALELGVTSFMMILGCFNILLAKLSNQEDIIVGIDVQGRRHADLHNIIGMFVNTLALRNFPASEKPFKDFLLQVKERTLEAFENQDFPFEELVEKVSVSRDPSRNPIFDVMFSLLDGASLDMHETTEEYTFPHTTEAPGYHYENKTAKFDLTFNATETPGYFAFSFEYCTKLFTHDTILRFIAYFKQLVYAVLENANRKIAALQMISDAEREQILFVFNNTRTPLVRDKSYDELFMDEVNKWPDRMAASYNERQITYRVLNEEAVKISQLLKTYGVSTNQPVPLYLRRSITMLASILGVFKAGGAYVPIEIDYPPSRVEFILENSDALVTITEPSYLEIVNNIHDAAADPSLLKKMGIICLPQDTPVPQTPGNSPESASQHPSGPDDLVYIIYTSGTTGKPKGVMIHQLGMINHLYAKINDLALTHQDIIAQTASACFDISVWQFLAAIILGGVTCIMDKEIVLEGRPFLKELQRKQVTILESVPSLMTAFLEVAGTESNKGLNQLRWMIPTGEPLSVMQAREWFRNYPTIKLVNAYGPTEASDDVTHYRVEEMPAETQTSISIGKPLQNLHIYILDKDLSLCPVGVHGEICVAGLGVGKGYWKDPEKTNKAFVANPLLDLIHDKEYTRIYKTGDIGYYLPDGRIECLGRKDFQVKIRGNRIELGEIESRLKTHEIVKEVVVIHRTTETGDTYLCAYIVPHVFYENIALDTALLQTFLAQYMPDYMIPSYFVAIEKIPLSQAGKTDRKALPAPTMKARKGQLLPRNPIEQQLASIWAILLAIPENQIGIDDDFFLLGGHSLKATILTARIHKELNVKIPLAEIFKSPTIRGLAEYIAQTRKDQYALIEPAEEREYYPLASVQKRMYILQQMTATTKSYNMPIYLPLAGHISLETLENTFVQLIKRHESLRTSFTMVKGAAVQVVHAAVPFKMEYYQLNGQDPQQLMKDFLRPFDLSQAPLLRAGLISVSPVQSILMADMHHIISDGVSQEILVKEFQALFKGEALPPLRVQYRDFSLWQNQLFQSGAMNAQKEYWLNLFKAHPLPVLNMPLDFPRPPVRNVDAGDYIEFTLAEPLHQRIMQLMENTQTTLSMFILAVYYSLLFHFTRQEDIIIGIIISGRTHADLENMIGMFVNTIPLRNHPEKQKSFSELLEEVKRNSMTAFDNQDYPLDELIIDLGLQGETGRNALFDVAFIMNNINDEKPATPATPPPATNSSNEKKNENEFAKFDLALYAYETRNEIQLALRYSTQLFKRATIEKLKKYYTEIVMQVLENVHIALKDIVFTHDLLVSKSKLQIDEDDFNI